MMREATDSKMTPGGGGAAFQCVLGKLISSSSEKPRALKIKQINVGLSAISFRVLFVFV